MPRRAVIRCVVVCLGPATLPALKPAPALPPAHQAARFAHYATPAAAPVPGGTAWNASSTSGESQAMANRSGTMLLHRLAAEKKQDHSRLLYRCMDQIQCRYHKSRLHNNSDNLESCRLCNIAHNRCKSTFWDDAQANPEMVNSAQTSEGHETIKVTATQSCISSFTRTSRERIHVRSKRDLQGRVGVVRRYSFSIWNQRTRP